jgi:hypothetical protein
MAKHLKETLPFSPAARDRKWKRRSDQKRKCRLDEIVQ